MRKGRRERGKKSILYHNLMSVCWINFLMASQHTECKVHIPSDSTRDSLRSDPSPPCPWSGSTSIPVASWPDQPCLALAPLCTPTFSVPLVHHCFKPILQVSEIGLLSVKTSLVLSRKLVPFFAHFSTTPCTFPIKAVIRGALGGSVG